MIDYSLGIGQFLMVWAVGFFLLPRKRLAHLPYGYQVALAFGLGELTISYLLFAFGLLGWLRFEIIIPLFSLTFLFLLPTLLLELRKIFSLSFRFISQSPISSLLVLMILAIYAAGAAVPEREFDALWYHLATPYHYISHGNKLSLVPFNMPSHYPMNGQLHYVISLLIGSDITAKVFGYCHFFPMLILLWSVVKRYSSTKWGIFALLVFLCCSHFRLPVMANVQRQLYFHVFLSTVMLWEGLERRDWKCFFMGALFCGMAMGTKFSALLFAYVAQFSLLVIWFFIYRKETVLGGLKKLAIHGVIAWMLFSPWLIKSYLYTGNPFYPMLGSVFETRADFVGPMEIHGQRHGLAFLQTDSWGDYYEGLKSNISWLLFNADAIFFLGLVMLLVLVFLKRSRPSFPVLSTAIAYLLFSIYWGGDVGRLFGVNYGAITVVITLGVAAICEKIPSKINYHRLLYGAIIAGLLFTLVQHKWYYLSRHNISWAPWQVYLSPGAKDGWMDSRKIFSAEMQDLRDWVAVHVPVDEVIYGYQSDSLFHLRHKNIVSGEFFGEQLDEWLEQGDDYALAQFRTLGVSWILVGEKYIYKGGANLQRFFDQHLTLQKQSGTVRLYRFNQAAQEIIK